MVVQVVTCEPVSTSEFPDTRENTGKWKVLGNMGCPHSPKYGGVSSHLRENSLLTGTGNDAGSNRERSSLTGNDLARTGVSGIALGCSSGRRH
jgi:hypothetical protein